MRTFKNGIIVLMMLVCSLNLFATEQQPIKPVKNIILMIPDGTSFAAVSLARWYQRYLNPDNKHLHIDPYMSGTVITYSSNAPIGDSAPTTSCYMTGMPSITGFVATYPWSDGKNDLIPVDSTKAYNPLATILEAAKIKKGYKTGLVFTCEFPHATPADCSAHSPKRKDYETIGSQMVHQNLNVVIGGGVGLMKDEYRRILNARGSKVFLNDLQAMRDHKNGNMWSLYGERDLPYDFDRDTTKYPSLSEMTGKAISLLNQDGDGFFLMVEGSKVDWAAHANDPVGIVSDFLAFDKACKVALDFAMADGNTAVVILPDHGNSGISIGKQSLRGYDKLSKDKLFSQLARFKYTASGLTKLINETPYRDIQKLFLETCGFELTPSELQLLNNCLDYKQSPIPVNDRKKDHEHALYSGSLETYISRLYTEHTSIGFTTHGHTGEEVFLACYNPNGQPLRGTVQNTDVNAYLRLLLGENNDLEALTQEIFTPHNKVFNNLKTEVKKDKAGKTILNVKGKKHSLTIVANTNVVIVDRGKRKQRIVELNSVIPYMKQTGLFYLPPSLNDLLK
ncbi:alkaline phosphatase [Porphyromonas macacae]|uniref:alkaline phosphatase n=1 Tax=Porphyromonas macacae TaxID=28115 RepID=UPI00052CDFAF|nr:alkaline phosphatase [Porphyromonas macacae]KGN99949.1 alkaline phosphatase [Porphyromonas macacae]